MISDTLSDAASEIRRYLKDMPHVYADTAPLIHDLLVKMDTVRILLDTPPNPGERSATLGKGT
jgi:hypothetical protein